MNVKECFKKNLTVTVNMDLKKKKTFAGPHCFAFLQPLDALINYAARQGFCEQRSNFCFISLSIFFPFCGFSLKMHFVL